MKTSRAFQYCLTTLMAACLLAMAGCACITPSPIPKTVPEIYPGILKGYLSKDAVPNSLALLPAPPAKESAAFAADEEAFRTTRPLINTPRWTMATKDANLYFPAAADTFSCALNVPVTEELMPNLYMLLRRSGADAGFATAAAKNRYKRTRPFVVNKETSCTPKAEEHLAKDGSYPSGHTAIGWTWALILAEIAPDRTDAVLSRGYAFGQSRVICGAHWQSDVNAGRVVGAAVFAKLHTDPVFLAQLEAAKKEFSAVRNKGQKPTNNCQTEANALSF